MRVDVHFGIVEVWKRGTYSKFHHFIFFQTATQVYYTSHPKNKGDKADLWVVIKTKPRGVVDTRYNMEVANQEKQSHLPSYDSCFAVYVLARDRRGTTVLFLSVYLAYKEDNSEKESKTIKQSKIKKISTKL